MNIPGLVDAVIPAIGGVACLIMAVRISKKRIKDGSRSDAAQAKKSKMLGTIGILLLVFVAYEVRTQINTSPVTPQIATLETTLAAYRQKLNQGLPKEVEPGLLLEKVETGKRSLIYQARFTKHTMSQIDGRAIEVKQTEYVKTNLCSHNEFVHLLEAGVDIVYEYMDKDGKIVATVYAGLARIIHEARHKLIAPGRRP